MYTIAESLQAISNYPISADIVENIIADEGLIAEDFADVITRRSKPYKLAKARVYEFLSTAPNISQGGTSISVSDTDKGRYRKLASDLRAEADDGSAIIYGYVGDDY